jgi:GNAT superfamily N-acetyltransferase
VYDGDDHPLAAHVAAHVAAPVVAMAGGTDEGTPSSDKVVAVGSIFPEDAPPWLAAVAADSSATTRWWRIRGMATAEGERGRGLGGAVLDRLLATAAERGGAAVWCNARVPAVGLYRRAGFHPVGEVFEVPVIGAHQPMWRAVAAGWDTGDAVPVSEDPPRPEGAVNA